MITPLSTQGGRRYIQMRSTASGMVNKLPATAGQQQQTTIARVRRAPHRQVVQS